MDTHIYIYSCPYGGSLIFNRRTTNNEAEMRYIIVQKETGYMDGFYITRMGAEGAIKIWQERYPDSEFDISSVAGTPAAIHDDSRYQI